MQSAVCKLEKNKKVGGIIQSKSEGLTNPEPSSRLKA